MAARAALRGRGRRRARYAVVRGLVVGACAGVSVSSVRDDPAVAARGRQRRTHL